MNFLVQVRRRMLEECPDERSRTNRQDVCEKFGSVHFSVFVFLDKCSTCGKTYKENFHLNEHIRVKHNGVAFVCFATATCRRRFTKKSDLDRHTKSVHRKSSRCTCRTCGRSFSRPDSLARHVRTQHLSKIASEDTEEM